MKDYPIIKIALAFICGILLQPFITVNILTVIIVASILIVALIIANNLKVFNRIQIVISLVSLLLIVMIGNISAQYSQNHFNEKLSNLYKEKNVIVSGNIEKIELIREKEILFLLNSDKLMFNDIVVEDEFTLLCKLRDSVLASNEFYDTMKPGFRVAVIGTYIKGKNRRNPGGFDYDRYLKSIGITGILNVDDYKDIVIIDEDSNFFKNAIFQSRKYIDEQIRKLHSTETASLLRGLLLADRKEIDKETKTQFINSGVVHVLAVSGLHVGFIALIIILLFGRFNIYFRSLLTIIGLIAFMLLTGVPPSVFRATVMAVVIIVAFLTNRTTNIFNSLAIAALIILTVNPYEIYSPGFQLSFSAVLAIGAIYPHISTAVNKLHIKSKIIKYVLLFFGVSLSAQLGTLPFTVFYFGKLSVIALLSNLIVIPAIGVIIALAVTTLLINSLLPVVASFYAVTNDTITSLLLSFINYTGELSYSHIKIPAYSVYDAVIFYLFLIFFLQILRKLKYKVAYALVLIFTVANVLVFSSLDDEPLLPDNELSVLMIDVGQGDAILIKTPDNKTILIDAGLAAFYFDYGESVILPLLDHLGIDKVDYGFVSHIDSDHYGGFVSLIQNDRIEEIYKPAPDTASKKDVRFEKFLTGEGVKINYYDSQVLIFNNCRLYFLSNKESNKVYNLSSNDSGGILKLVYGNRSFLFTGDAESRVENILVDDYRIFLDVDVLKLGHHGSKTSTSPKFLYFTSPDIALVSAGIKNKFGHPHSSVIKRLSEKDVNILRTDESGAILLTCDGENIVVEKWR
ncbi:MAG: DNA internalization-related competence protein ComEC/Rec2 [Ignavibacterium sp.]|nr:MAG: DNA internalization-related competence protein ComEC/Rec2 [Ignavibacterium sp.]